MNLDQLDQMDQWDHQERRVPLATRAPLVSLVCLVNVVLQERQVQREAEVIQVCLDLKALPVNKEKEDHKELEDPKVHLEKLAVLEILDLQVQPVNLVQLA